MNDELTKNPNLDKIKIKCLGESVKNKLTDVLSGDKDLKKILKSVIAAPSCGEDIPKKKTERSNFLGSCMRSAAKGGMGKKMSECSIMFKEMPESEKKKYNPKEI